MPALRGRVVVNAFFEDSTRTRTSFSLAASRLSADIIDFSEKGSSVSKGETLIDTARNIEAMGVDVIVLRHRAAGAAEMLSRAVRSSVINAGDGAHEHPTQGLLDLYTIRERFGRIAGLKVAIVGDIVNSRVARSNLWGLKKLGAEVILVGPPTLLPRSFESLGARCVHDFDSVVARSGRHQHAARAVRADPEQPVSLGARIHAVVRAAFRTVQPMQAGRVCDAPRPDEPRDRNRLEHRRWTEQRNSDAGDQRFGGANGGVVSRYAGGDMKVKLCPAS